MLSPPIPLKSVKSPCKKDHMHSSVFAFSLHIHRIQVETRDTRTPWIMKFGMIRWKMLSLKCSGLPLLPTPFSPVHNARKFSTVFGTVLPYNPMTMRPASLPPIDTSKYTWFVTFGPLTASAVITATDATSATKSTNAVETLHLAIFPSFSILVARAARIPKSRSNRSWNNATTWFKRFRSLDKKGCCFHFTIEDATCIAAKEVVAELRVSYKMGDVRVHVFDVITRFGEQKRQNVRKKQILRFKFVKKWETGCNTVNLLSKECIRLRTLPPKLHSPKNDASRKNRALTQKSRLHSNQS